MVLSNLFVKFKTRMKDLPEGHRQTTPVNAHRPSPASGKDVQPGANQVDSIQDMTANTENVCNYGRKICTIHYICITLFRSYN